MGTIELTGIRKEYGKATKRKDPIVALDDVSFEVPDGEFFCLLGPSGAGKTTTLKVIAGLEEPQRGAVRLDDVDATAAEPGSRNLAMCFESYALYPQWNVFDNLASPLRSPRFRDGNGTDEVRRRVREVAELLSVGHLLDRDVTQLSNGQRQRVALGRVLVRPASAYLLDEPLAHLDAKLRATMRSELKAIGQRDRTTTVYVTHDYVEALALGDRIGVLAGGRVLQVGTPQEIWNEPADAFVARAFGKPRINLVEGGLVERDGGLVFVADTGGLEVPVGPVRVGAGTRVSLGIRPREIRLATETDRPAAHRADDAGRGETGRVTVDGRIYVLEHLGRQTEVTVKVGEELLSLVVPRVEAHGRDIDDPVRITLPAAACHVFEPGDEGRRVNA